MKAKVLLSIQLSAGKILMLDVTRMQVTSQFYNVKAFIWGELINWMTRGRNAKCPLGHMLTLTWKCSHQNKVKSQNFNSKLKTVHNQQDNLEGTQE